MRSTKGPGKFYAKKCDVSQESEVVEVFNWIKNTFGHLHILVNNAGLFKLGTIEGIKFNLFSFFILGLFFIVVFIMMIIKNFL